MFLAEWIDWLPRLLGGLVVSLQLTAAVLAIGLPLGVLLALMVDSRLRILRWVSLVLVEFGRGVPSLVLIYLVYLGLPPAGLTLSAFVSVTIALATNCAAYSSEIFRAGIGAVPKGQREAAKAIGLGAVQELRKIVLPQAVRNVIPPLLGYSIIVFQGTSLAFVIGISELLNRAYSIGSTTFQFLSVLVLAGVLYAVIAIPASRLISRFEVPSGAMERRTFSLVPGRFIGSKSKANR